ncbi:hypothetical protein BAUCODRAFT_152852 [Baudoinia panamericana UAMH 10762]|uniref:Uncharacterized protein n=1 Tax=Baudoinia panamericana (strain UAMH 10762) TaxID=717646 RepID=M2M2W0_BAUPA|nr:uncharacterized protein BAUCODRAFT_152852 [Baudoinia panamericana UAMH 10762]EMC90866.1 hypothetical protein BAUCODRAFT_152852 [Baudoinia panamericana UAMH 10762]
MHGTPADTMEVVANGSGATTTTLYPKISGKLIDLNTSLLGYVDHTIFARPVPFTGTIKLHGTHADMIVRADNTIGYESRDRTDLDHGERQLRLHIVLAINSEGSLLMAGKWIGQGIQKGVAIAKLPRCFVPCGIRLAEAWEPIELYAGIEDSEAGMLNINRGGFYHLEYSIAYEGVSFLAKARELRLAVAASCAFGRAMGIEGEGEGIVWTPAANSNLPNVSKLWFKTQAEHFNHNIKLKVAAEKAMERAWQYLAEMGTSQTMQSIGIFFRWLTDDLALEERREIELMKLDGA